MGCASLPQKGYRSVPEKLYYEGMFYLEHGNDFNNYYEKALSRFDQVIDNYKGSKYEPLARLAKGRVLFKEGKYTEAAVVFDEFISLYPFHAEVPQAKYLLAECYYRLSDSFDRDLNYIQMAYQQFGDFLTLCSQRTQKSGFCKNKVDGARRYYREIKEKLARRIYYIGKFYLKRGYRLAALSRFRELISMYPDTSYGKKAEKLVTKIEKEIWKEKR